MPYIISLAIYVMPGGSLCIYIPIDEKPGESIFIAIHMRCQERTYMYIYYIYNHIHCHALCLLCTPYQDLVPHDKNFFLTCVVMLVLCL